LSRCAETCTSGSEGAGRSNAPGLPGGTTVNKKYQKNTPKTSTGQGLAVPDEVTIAMGEIADDLREGLLALAVGALPASDGFADGGLQT
jgi:hypothetical protein